MLGEFGIVLPKGAGVLLSRRADLLADRRLAGMDRLERLMGAQKNWAAPRSSGMEWDRGAQPVFEDVDRG
jgi:hypothetical protein